MKLASFLYQGKRSYGIVQADGVIDLGRRLGDRYSDLKALLQGNGLAQATRYLNDAVDVPMSAITFLPVIEQPEKILCVGMNYADKRKEFDQHNPAPTLFVRFPDSQTGHNEPVLKPRHSSEFDYEGELAVIIGKGGENISRDDALRHVAGYSCYMDGSARDWQHTWFTAGKNWRQTGAFGPWMATADEIPDPHQLAIRTWLNGRMVQEDNTSSMIHKVAELIEYISTFTRLSPGDVIITGSPGGVGKKRNPPLFMKEGDRIEVEIEHEGQIVKAAMTNKSLYTNVAIQKTGYAIDFRHTLVAKHPERLSQIRYLLADSGLGLDNDITLFVEAWSGSQLVGCAGLAANVIKCVAVNEQLRGENLSARLLAEVENAALERGHFHLFLCTRPCNRERFARSGFWPIAQSGNNAVLTDNTPQGIERYCRSLRAKRKSGENIGAIVMNANPFTLGHRHLVEQAAQQCDALHLFVVREDASFFPFSARIEMVRAGVAHLPNVVVHEGSQYIISRATFPAYFLKETGKVQQAWSEIDVLIFRDFIAPALGITHRFIGSEPFCDITRQYNQTLHDLLASHIEVVEMPRIKATGNAISASEVRRLLKTQQFSRIREIVPDSTFAHLETHYRASPEVA